MKFSLDTYIGDCGQMVRRLTACAGDGETLPDAADIELKNCYTDYCLSVENDVAATRATVNEREIIIETDPFLYRGDFSISFGTGSHRVTVTKENIDEIAVEGEEEFARCNENGVLYRLYSPLTDGPRPLILFLHGGGECGEDNLLQLTGTLGAITLAQRFPDFYVMAPQAPSFGSGVEEITKRIQNDYSFFHIVVGAPTRAGKGECGWNREYLSLICRQIRRMIADARVDQQRVYVIGMSMGGGGTLRALSVDPELFAAAVPICPSMNGETYPILCNLPDVPTHIATAYIDHQISRHAYIYNACCQLWDKGRTDVKYTIFTPEELEAYKIGVGNNLKWDDIKEANHNSWVLVMHNEHGILDWMISKRNTRA